jgi:hypothetical protein
VSPCIRIKGSWMCGPGVDSAWVCSIPGCEEWSEFLCDWPMGEGKTCDAPLCSKHAAQIGPEYHLCPVHAAMFKREHGRTVNPKPNRPALLKMEAAPDA